MEQSSIRRGEGKLDSTRKYYYPGETSVKGAEIKEGKTGAWGTLCVENSGDDGQACSQRTQGVLPS